MRKKKKNVMTKRKWKNVMKKEKEKCYDQKKKKNVMRKRKRKIILPYMQTRAVRSIYEQTLRIKWFS